MSNEDDIGFSFSPDELATMDEMTAPEPLPEYRSAVVQAAIVHVGGDETALSCICARCPAAVWTIGDARAAPIAENEGIAHASDQAPWSLSVFCRVMHKDITSFAPDYRKAGYGVRGGSVIAFCDAYEDELKGWQARQ